MSADGTLTPPITVEIPKDVLDRHASWYRWFLVCHVGHFVIGIVGTVGAIVLTYPPLLKEYNSAVALVVAACSATMAFIKISAKARAFIAAWRILGKAIDDFRSGRIDAASLRDVKNKCEMEILGDHALLAG